MITYNLNTPQDQKQFVSKLEKLSKWEDDQPGDDVSVGVKVNFLNNKINEWSLLTDLLRKFQENDEKLKNVQMKLGHEARPLGNFLASALQAEQAALTVIERYAQTNGIVLSMAAHQVKVQNSQKQKSTNGRNFLLCSLAIGGIALAYTNSSTLQDSLAKMIPSFTKPHRMRPSSISNSNPLSQPFGFGRIPETTTHKGNIFNSLPDMTPYVPSIMGSAITAGYLYAKHAFKRKSGSLDNLIFSSAALVAAAATFHPKLAASPLSDTARESLVIAATLPLFPQAASAAGNFAVDTTKQLFAKVHPTLYEQRSNIYTGFSTCLAWVVDSCFSPVFSSMATMSGIYIAGEAMQMIPAPRSQEEKKMSSLDTGKAAIGALSASTYAVAHVLSQIDGVPSSIPATLISIKDTANFVLGSLNYKQMAVAGGTIAAVGSLAYWTYQKLSTRKIQGNQTDQPEV
jgi:hypothetical protein